MKIPFALISLFVLFSIETFGQETTIRFSLENSKLKAENISQEGVTLPLIMKFSSDLHGKEIDLRDENGNRVYKGTFGNQVIAVGEETDYTILIDSDGSIAAVTDSGTSKVNTNSFTVNLSNDTGTKLKIKIKRGANQIANDGTSNESDYESGYLLYDAIYIIENLKPGKPNEAIVKILSHYDIRAANISENKYLNEQLSGVFQTIQGDQEVNLQGSKSLLSTIGGINVTTIADGFAKFIVKRTKQELTIAFFEKLQDQLEELEDLQTVFPQTFKTLKTIGDDIYMFEAYLQTLREVFEKDLATLPANLPKIIDNHPEFFEANPELEAMLRTGFYIAHSFQEKLHPGVIIENYDSELWHSSKPNYEAAFQTLKLLSASLKAKDDSDNYWAPKSDVEELFKDDKLLKIYLGLLEQEAKKENIKFHGSDGVSIEVSNIIDKSFTEVSNISKYKAFVKNISFKTRTLDAKVKHSKEITNDSLSFENYYSIVSLAIDLMKEGVKVEDLPHFPNDMDIQKKSKKYFDVAQTASGMVVEVHRRNYSSVIVDASYLYSEIFEKKAVSDFAEAKTNVALDKNGKVKKETDSLTLRKSKNALFKYGAFIAAIAQADSSEEVQNTLEAFALPAGSSRIKRETKFNVSLNAYCGLFSGIEKIKDVDDGAWNSYGVTAPIGFSISKGHSIFFIINTPKSGWSSSLFLSVVDIGAIASFRFTDDDAERVPNIELKDIISPGAFISIGIPKSPISINAGWQVGPLLRKVNLEENTFGNSYTRFSVSLTVDIPILNLYTK